MDLEATPETRNWSIALKREGTAGRSPRNDKCTRVSWHSQPAAQTWAQLPGLMVNHKLSQPSNPCPDATSTTRPCVPAQAPGCRDTRSSRLLYKYNLPASPSLGKSTCPAIAMLVELRQEVLAARPVYHPPSSATATAREPSLSRQADILYRCLSYSPATTCPSRVSEKLVAGQDLRNPVAVHGWLQVSHALAAGQIPHVPQRGYSRIP
jgi:hypothetical protein